VRQNAAFAVVDPVRRNARLTVIDKHSGRNCRVCGAKGGLLALAKALGIDLPNRARVRSNAKREGITLAQYAELKHLDLGFLAGEGLTDAMYAGAPAVWIPFPTEMRLAIGLIDSVFLARRIAFRSCLHPMSVVLGAAERAGLRPVERQRGLLWEVTALAHTRV